LQYADALGNLSLPTLQPWAQEHPPGLFVAGAMLMKLGLSVDVLIGWMWNLIPVALAGLFAWVTAKRLGNAVGAAILLIAVLSLPYYDGFFAMYWKVYASLAFVILTYHFIEKWSPWFLLTALLAIVVHHQTGLILVLAVGIWWLLALRTRWNEKLFLWYTIALGVVALIGIVVYLPHWERAVWSPLKSIFLLRGDKAPSGAFPEISFYLKMMPLLWALGVVGFVRSIQKDRGSLWQISVIVCAIFVVCKLVFYKRFVLQLDFFLMPFAAEALVWFWSRYKGKVWKYSVVLLIAIQIALTLKVMAVRLPRITTDTLLEIERLNEILPPDAKVVALENVTGMWLLGWTEVRTVGAPGLFDFPAWNYAKWEKFIDGRPEQRKAILGSIDGPLYFYVSDYFTRYYGERSQNVLKDPCLKQIDKAVLHSICSP
jgi:hypothetical protein